MRINGVSVELNSPVDKKRQNYRMFGLVIKVLHLAQVVWGVKLGIVFMWMR